MWLLVIRNGRTANFKLGRWLIRSARLSVSFKLLWFDFLERTNISKRFLARKTLYFWLTFCPASLVTSLADRKIDCKVEAKQKTKITPIKSHFQEITRNSKNSRLFFEQFKIHDFTNRLRWHLLALTRTRKKLFEEAVRLKFFRPNYCAQRRSCYSLAFDFVRFESYPIGFLPLFCGGNFKWRTALSVLKSWI